MTEKLQFLLKQIQQKLKLNEAVLISYKFYEYMQQITANLLEENLNGWRQT
jgi:hypothetical protein